MWQQLAIAALILGITGIALLGQRLPNSNAAQVKVSHVTAEHRQARHAAGQLDSVPEVLITNPEKFRIIHESLEKDCAVTIPTSDAEAEQLFTKLLRYNMSSFSKYPQCWILRMMAKSTEQTRSFSTAHINALHFQPGDLFCGFNRVLKRSPTRIEIELVPPRSMTGFSGRLLLSLVAQHKGAVLRTETLQWTEIGGSIRMPLERPAAQYMHEVASQRLLVFGAKYLEEL